MRKPVGVKEMREFFGVMASHGLKRGTYATTSRHTPDALAFAKANGINAQDGNRFWGCVNFPRCKRTLVMRVT